MKVIGQVSDRESGHGIAAALVRLVDHESILVEGESNLSGRYALELDLAGKPHLLGRPAQVKASKEGFEPGMADFTLEDREYSFDLQIHSEPEDLVVFVNRLDGSPIEGVQILFTMGKTIVQTSLTDANGLASWEVPAHRLDQQALLKISKDGWYKVERLALLRRDQPRVQVTLEPSTTDEVPLSGRVFDDKGHPLPGARVTLELPGAAPANLVTDADGRWSLVLEPDLYGGEGLLHAEHPSFHPARDIKLPLMPEAMHVVPMTPLKSSSGGPPWKLVLAAAGVLIAIVAALLISGVL